VRRFTFWSGGIPILAPIAAGNANPIVPNPPEVTLLLEELN
jgi:hypothetical protein